MDSPATRSLLAFAETVSVELAGMSDDALRDAARRMTAPFMHELALRGCSYTLRSEDFLVHPTTKPN